MNTKDILLLIGVLAIVAASMKGSVQVQSPFTILSPSGLQDQTAANPSSPAQTWVEQPMTIIPVPTAGWSQWTGVGYEA